LNDIVKNTVLWLVVIGIVVLVFSNFENKKKPDALSYSEFVTAVNAGQVKSIKIDGEGIQGERKDKTVFETVRPAGIPDNSLMPSLAAQKVDIQGAAPDRQSVWMQLLVASFPVLLIIGLIMFFMRNMQGGGSGSGGGRGPMSFGKSKAKLLT